MLSHLFKLGLHFVAFVLVTGCQLVCAQQLAPLPLEVALDIRTFPEWTPIDLSPDGQWVAFTVKQRVTSDGGLKNSRTGTYTRMVGADVWLSNLKTNESRNLTQGKGSSWGPAWSPDGERLAFYSDRGGFQTLWVWDRKSDTVRQVSEAKVHVLAPFQVPQWIPDGTKVLTVVWPEGLDAAAVEKAGKPDLSVAGAQSHETSPSVVIYRGGAENDRPTRLRAPTWCGDLVVVDVSNGAFKRLTRDFVPMWFRPSPDGSRVAFTSWAQLETEKTLQVLYDLAVVDLPDGKPRVLVSHMRQMWGMSVSWSPTGTMLAYTTSGPLAQGDCFIVPLSAGEPKNATPSPHPKFGHPFRPPIWDREGKNVYLLATESKEELHLGQLWKIAVPAGAARQVASIPGYTLHGVIAPQSGSGFWSLDAGRSMVLIGRNDESLRFAILKVDLSTGNYVVAVEENKFYAEFDLIWKMDVSSDERHVIYTAQDAQHPEDIWVLRTDLVARRVTDVNPQVDNHVMGTSRLVEWRSIDGQRLRGVLLLPAGYMEGRKCPLIVYPYPNAMRSSLVNLFGVARFPAGTENMQVLATRGYAVLLPDAPVRVGTAMQGILKAVMPGVDRVVELGIADPDRLGLMGHSSGGYGVLCLIVQTTRFKVAVSRSGFSDLIRYATTMDSYGGATSMQETEGNRTGGTLWDRREAFIENSPVFYLDKVQTPLLLTHGTADSISSAAAEETFVALRRLGKKVVYAKYEGEGHPEVDWRYGNQMDFLQRLIAWFDEHLKGSS